MRKQGIITAIDIGTSKVCTIIARSVGDNKLELLGVGVHRSLGLENGIVRDINRAAQAIRESVREAETTSQTQARNVYIGISGDHIRSGNASGRIPITDPTGSDPNEITEKHIRMAVTDAERAISTQAGFENCEIIHGIPLYFDIDNQKGVINPINMTGFHLQSHVHVVLADMTAMRNLLKCMELADLSVSKIVLAPIASSIAVLDDDERELGSVMVDIGGGTTDITVYMRGEIRFSQVRPMGGNTLTRDLTKGLPTTLPFAETLKLQYGSAIASMVDDKEEIELKGIGGRPSIFRSRRFIAEIIEARCREILENAYRTVVNSYSHELMTAGLTLTGGMALMENIDKLAAKIFNIPVKIGLPNLSRLTEAPEDMKSPVFSTVIGLLYFGAEQTPVAPAVREKRKKSTSETKFMEKMKSWLKKLNDYL